MTATQFPPRSVTTRSPRGRHGVSISVTADAVPPAIAAAAAGPPCSTGRGTEGPAGVRTSPVATQRRQVASTGRTGRTGRTACMTAPDQCVGPPYHSAPHARRHGRSLARPQRRSTRPHRHHTDAPSRARRLPLLRRGWAAHRNRTNSVTHPRELTSNTPDAGSPDRPHEAGGGTALRPLVGVVRLVRCELCHPSDEPSRALQACSPRWVTDGHPIR